MKKAMYKFLSFMPGINLVSNKQDFFYGKPSGILELFWENPSSKIFWEWMRQHPKEVLTNDIAKKLIAKTRDKELLKFL